MILIFKHIYNIWERRAFAIHISVHIYFQFDIHAVRIFGRKLPPVDCLPPFHIHIDRFRRGDFRFHIQLAQHEADRVATQLPVQEAQVLQVRLLRGC